VSKRPLVPDLNGEDVTVGAFLDRQVPLLCDAHRRGDRIAGALLRATTASRP